MVNKFETELAGVLIAASIFVGKKILAELKNGKINVLIADGKLTVKRIDPKLPIEFSFNFGSLCALPNEA